MLRHWKEKVFEKGFVPYDMLGVVVIGTDKFPTPEEIKENPKKYEKVLGDTVIGYNIPNNDGTWDFIVSIACCLDGTWIEGVDDKIEDVRRLIPGHVML